MSPCAPEATEPRHSIAKTEKGWQLVIQNEHFSVMQVFRSESTAREAIDRMMEFFQSMSPPSKGRDTSSVTTSSRTSIA
jgi:hypothetical protein